MVVIHKNDVASHRIVDEPIRYSDRQNKITRLPDGGFRFESTNEDEFGNESSLEIILTKEDIDHMVELVNKGLI